MDAFIFRKRQFHLHTTGIRQKGRIILPFYDVLRTIRKCIFFSESDDTYAVIEGTFAAGDSLNLISEKKIINVMVVLC